MYFSLTGMVFILPIIIGAVVAWFVLKDQRPQFLRKLLDGNASPSQISRDANSDNALEDDWAIVSTPSGGKRKNKNKR